MLSDKFPAIVRNVTGFLESQKTCEVSLYFYQPAFVHPSVAAMKLRFE